MTGRPCEHKSKIEYLYNDVVEIRKDIKKILQRVSKVEVRASLWGGFSGIVVTIVGWILTKGVK